VCARVCACVCVSVCVCVCVTTGIRMHAHEHMTGHDPSLSILTSTLHFFFRVWGWWGEALGGVGGIGDSVGGDCVAKRASLVQAI
jgi:hypothetical protein